MAVFRVEDLSSEMCERLASDNEELRKVITELKSEISLRDKKREELESQNEDLEDKIEDLESQNEDLENKIEDLEDKNEELRKLIILVNSLTSTIEQQA